MLPAGLPTRYLFRPTQPGHPQWVGAMSTGIGFGHRRLRSDKFYIVDVGPVASLIKPKLRQLNGV